MIGAVLTQNTSWLNVEKALLNFAGKLSPLLIEEIDHNELATIIKPCGYYNQKAKYLKAITQWFKGYNYDPSFIRKTDGMQLRNELLAINGVGPETADSILLYAFDKAFFVVDAYTRRVFLRWGFTVPGSYESFRIRLESYFKKDYKLFGNYHGCIVNLAKDFCLTKPRCELCPLTDRCPKLI